MLLCTGRLIIYGIYLNDEQHQKTITYLQTYDLLKLMIFDHSHICDKTICIIRYKPFYFLTDKLA